MATPEEMRSITNQFKENAEDLQAYLRDLDQWTDEMNKKDEQLKKMKTSIPNTDEGNKNVQEKKRKVPSKKEESPGEKKPKEQRISSYDYAKWDKFDVEQELAESDPEMEQDEEDEEVSQEQLVQQALMLKDKGNEYFKAGKYEKAIESYTQSIQCDSTNPILPANRAMAFLKTNLFGAAEQDCTVALDHDPTYTKALLRRGTARVKLGKLESAEEDFKRALELEPKNRQAKQDLEKVQELIQARVKELEQPATEDRNKKTSFGDNIKAAFSSRNKQFLEVEPKQVDKMEILEVGQFLPIKKSPHQRSKQPLERIEITEVETFSDDLFVKSIESGSDAGAAKKGPLIETLSESHVSGQTTSEKMEKKISFQQKVEKEICAEMERTELSAVKGTSLSKIPVKPKNSVQFSSCWKALDSLQRCKYLLQISSSDYPKIFKHSLEPKMFGEIIRVIDRMDSEDIFSQLLGLSKIPRISAIIMFLEKNERDLISTLLTKVSGVKGSNDKEISALKSCFLL